MTASAAANAILPNSGRRFRMPPRRTRVQEVWAAQYGPGHALLGYDLYPSACEEWDVTVQSWGRADRSGLDVPLADAVARWLATDWPWERVHRCGR
jgi:hypothetical protein